jgi:hypothetical protein
MVFENVEMEVLTFSNESLQIENQFVVNNFKHRTGEERQGSQAN